MGAIPTSDVVGEHPDMMATTTGHPPHPHSRTTSTNVTDTSPWSSHMPNDMSASWTHPLAHRPPAEQPISHPAPTPCRSDVAPCAVMHHHSVMHPATMRVPSTRYDVPDHWDMSLGPLNQGPPSRDASLCPQHASHIPDASDADPTASRPPGTAGMLPIHGLPPVVRPHDLRMPLACTTACPNPRACPQGSRMPAMQPTGRPKPQCTPSCRTPCCDAFLCPQHAPHAPNDVPHPWARPQPHHMMAQRRPGHPVRTYRAAARR